MAEGSGTFVVGLRDDGVDIDGLKSAVSRIEGVVNVEFNYFTRKLMVHYDGSVETLRKINKKLEGIKRTRA